MTPDEIAQRVLDRHAIRDDWRRTGAQVRDLIVEAIYADQEQNPLTLRPEPLGENRIFGLREQAASISFTDPEGKAVLDHNIGFGGLTFMLTVTIDDRVYQEAVTLTPVVQEWVRIIADKHKRDAS